MGQRYFRHEGADTPYDHKVDVGGHIVRFGSGKVPVDANTKENGVNVADGLASDEYPNIYEVDEEGERLPEAQQNVSAIQEEETEEESEEEGSGDEPHTVTGQDEVETESEVEAEEEDTDKESMADDYLDQNASVVRESLRSDDLEDETLEDLLEHERNNKDRVTVKEEIENQLGE